MPVHGMNMGKCPANAADPEPTGYVRVFVDVTGIIIVNEVVPERLAKNNPRKHRQADANPGSYPLSAGCFAKSN